MRISDWSSDVCSSDLDDQHGRLTVQDGHVNLTYLPPTDGGRFVAVVILDEDTPDRLYAISRLWAAIRSRPVPADNRITEQRRKRIPQMLRVVDGRDRKSTRLNSSH